MSVTLFNSARAILERFNKTHIQVNSCRIVRKDAIVEYYHSLRLVELSDGTAERVEEEFTRGIRDEINRRKGNGKK